jgi:hypothetical protein
MSLIWMQCCSWWGIMPWANVTSAWLCAPVAGVELAAADEPAELVPLVADLLLELLHAVMVTIAAIAAAPMISTHRLITSSPLLCPHCD